MNNRIVMGTNHNPYFNLALEEYLFDEQATRLGATLYLWQNQNTVVIGKNQNAWNECTVALLEDENGQLARRSSGGGAVFQDLGNLNFTFIVPRHVYDLERQFKVVQGATKSFGIDTEFTGRNDLVISKTGAKFSGNAFRFTGKVGMHHGTLLIDVDMGKLSRYLAPPKDKLDAKGIKSVRSRVENLCEHNNTITIDDMKTALINSFIKEYGPAQLYYDDSFMTPDLDMMIERYASWDWRLGRTPRFDIEFGARFTWGGVMICLELRDGVIVNAKVYSDAMDEELIESIAPLLIGSHFSSREMASRVVELSSKEAVEIADWILEKGY